MIVNFTKPKREFFLELLKCGFLVLTAFMSLSGTLFAQQNVTVTGTVTDQTTGETFPGVNVKVKGKPNGVVTDNEGRFSITVLDNATLEITFLGYKKQEIPVNGKKLINVSLTSSSSDLNEVVVVGYGTERKSDVTGLFPQ